MEILKAIFLGIVQGITEWLPISSTGHMILVDEFLKLKMSDAFREMFFVVIQLGSILAVVVLYFHKLNPFSPKKTPPQRWQTLVLWSKVLVGILPAGIIGLLFDDVIDRLFYGSYLVVAVALIAYGVLFIIIENLNKNRRPSTSSLEQLSYRSALEIGLFQVLALVPGTSRSGSTILGGMLCGVSRPVAAEFSFFLAVPVMAGASLLKIVKFGKATGFVLTGLEWGVLGAGCAVAFVVSLFAIRFLVDFVRRHDFKPFGWYRIALGAVVLGYFWFFAKG